MIKPVSPHAKKKVEARRTTIDYCLPLEKTGSCQRLSGGNGQIMQWGQRTWQMLAREHNVWSAWLVGETPAAPDMGLWLSGLAQEYSRHRTAYGLCMRGSNNGQYY
jgi:hypothetical protein